MFSSVSYPFNWNGKCVGKKINNFTAQIDLENTLNTFRRTYLLPDKLTDEHFLENLQ